MSKDYSSEDKAILEAIQSFNGIPSSEALAKLESLPYPATFISKRIKANRVLSQAQNKRAIEYIKQLPLDQLKTQTAKQGGLISNCKDHPLWLKPLHQRIDAEVILPAIRSFRGIPTPTALASSGSIPYSHTLISERIKTNLILARAQDKRAVEYIKSLSVDELKAQTAKQMGLTSICQDNPKLLKALHKRIDLEIILPAIQSFNGIPIPTVLTKSKALPYSAAFISQRIKANSTLSGAQNKRAVEYIKQLTVAELKAQSGKQKGLILICRNYSSYLNVIYQRIEEEILLPIIQSFNGIPTSKALARLRSLPYNRKFIAESMDSNPALIKAQNKRALEYIKALPVDDLKAQTATQEGLFSICKNHPSWLDSIYKRIALEILLPVIQSFNGIPTSRALKNLGLLPYSRHFISECIQSYPELFLAIAQKKGLTPDQAVELALERNDETPAAKAALSQRLNNLHAFREMVGLLRSLGHLFTNRTILEVSLYPRPLTKAAGELGLFLPIGYEQMQTFHQGKSSELPTARTVVLQSIHRLTSESLTNLFRQVHVALAEDGIVIATYSRRHAPVDGFLESLEAHGFTITEQGILHIAAPSDQTLRNAGVAADDIARAKSKISGSSDVIVLSKRIPSEAVSFVPALLRLQGQEKHDFEYTDGVPFTLPDSLANQLKASFLLSRELATLPKDPFILEIMDAGQVVALAGFGTHPLFPRMAEASSYPNAPAADYPAIARRLATNAELRRSVGIQPGHIARVPLQRLS
ncbi:hypothetical protein HY988_05690 [Candidatus Micrarchaeota archaeon]|nr:hypothetical protein [Candidatus Micrarchaeota archaeon]